MIGKAGKPSEAVFVKKLEYAVEKAKKNREWRHEYMPLLMRDQENVKMFHISAFSCDRFFSVRCTKE